MFEAFILGRWRALYYITERFFERESADSFLGVLEKLRVRANGQFKRPRRVVIYEER